MVRMLLSHPLLLNIHSAGEGVEKSKQSEISKQTTIRLIGFVHLDHVVSKWNELFLNSYG